MAEHNRTKLMTKSTNDETGEVKLSFTNGGSIVVKLSELNDAIKNRAALHGIAQKVGDAAAGKSGDEAYEACLGVFERLMTGEWSKTGEKGEGTRPSMVIEAIFRALTEGGKAPVMADLVAKYTGDGAEDKRKTALTNPQVKKHYEALRAEAAAARAAKAADAAGKADAPGLDSL